MALQEAAIKALLTGDSGAGGINTLAGGNIFINPDDFANNDGATSSNLDAAGAYDANGNLEPCAVIAFGVDTKSNIQLGERRFFSVYLYDESGFATIRNMKQRLKIVLDRKTINSDDETANYIEYVDSGPEFIDEGLQNASASWVRCFVLYTRSQ